MGNINSGPRPAKPAPGLGAKIRALRTKRGLSGNGLAREAGITNRPILEAEYRNRITWRTALRIAPILGVRPEELMPTDL